MIEVVRGDITTLRVDAVVNAANTGLGGGGGVDGALHAAAGPELVRASRPLGPCPPGGAVLTPGFRLPARYVIHAVGPIWRGGVDGEADTLRRAYEQSFQLALRQGDIRTIAFPSISTGAYGFPTAEAAGIALEVMHEFEADFERIVACVYDKDTEIIYRGLLR